MALVFPGCRFAFLLKDQTNVRFTCELKNLPNTTEVWERTSVNRRGSEHTVRGGAMAVALRRTAIESGALVWRPVVAGPSIMFLSITTVTSRPCAKIPLSLPVSWARGRCQWRSTQEEEHCQDLLCRQVFLIQSGTHWRLITKYCHNVMWYLSSTMDCMLESKTEK